MVRGSVFDVTSKQLFVPGAGSPENRRNKMDKIMKRFSVIALAVIMTVAFMPVGLLALGVQSHGRESLRRRRV